MADVKKGFGKVVGNGEVKNTLSLKDCMVVIEEMGDVLCALEEKIGNKKKFKLTRKEMVMEVIKDGGLYSLSEVAERVSVMAGVTITNKNISSQLTYLRDDLGKEGLFDIVKTGRGHGKLKLIKIS